MIVAPDVGEEAVAAQDTFHRFRPRPGADRPDRDVALDGLRGDREICAAGEVDLVMRAGIHQFAVPESANEINAFIQHFGPDFAIEFVSGCAKEIVDGAKSNGKNGASI